MSWPRVNMDDVSTEWWDEVMKLTSATQYEKYFISTASEFTIRAIVYVILTKSHDEVAWFLHGSIHADKIVNIRDLVQSKVESEKKLGTQKLIELIQEYNDYALDD